MQEIYEIIKELKTIRKLPQFMLIAGIQHSSTIKARKAVQEFIKANPKEKEIDLILESPGGSADLAYSIIKTFRENFETVNIIVPYWAKSAATLLALGGSTIIMDEFGEFGPLDVQLRTDDELPDSAPQSGLVDEYALTIIENRSLALYERMMKKLLKKPSSFATIDIRIKKTALSNQVFNYVSNFYRPLFEKIDPYQIGEKARSLAVAERYAERILNQYNSENMKKTIKYFVDYIVHECPDHGYIIDYSIMSIFLKNIKKSSEISKDYYNALTKLSLKLFTNIGEYEYVGFFNEDLLVKNIKKVDTGKKAGPKEKNERSKK